MNWNFLIAFFGIIIGYLVVVFVVYLVKRIKNKRKVKKDNDEFKDNILK